LSPRLCECPLNKLPDESIGSEVIPKYKIGDLNQDGHTNMADLLIALKVTAGMNEIGQPGCGHRRR